MENVFIRVNKLDDFNPRTDAKKHYWARVDLDIHCSRSLIGLDCEQRWFFICLIGLAVKYRNDKEFVPFDIPYLADISKVSLEKIASALEILRTNKTLSFIHENGDELESPAQNFPKNSKNGAYNTDIRTDNTDKTDVRADSAEAAALSNFLNTWNENCGPELSKVRALSKKRKASIRARLAEESSPTYWVEVVKRIAASDFCCGQTGKGWRADFDWLLQPDTHIKVLEGKYDNRSPSPPDQSSQAVFDLKLKEMEQARAKREGRASDAS